MLHERSHHRSLRWLPGAATLLALGACATPQESPVPSPRPGTPTPEVVAQDDTSIEGLEQALESDPGLTITRIRLGERLMECGRHGDAVIQYGQLAAAGFDSMRPADELLPPAAERPPVKQPAAPDTREGWIGRAHTFGALALLSLGRSFHAQTPLQRLVELAPDRRASDALNDHAFAWLREHRPEPALALLDVAIQVCETNPLAHNNRGWALFQLDRATEALLAHDRAIALSDSCSEAHFNRGLTLAALGRHREAVGAYDRVIELAPPRVADAHYCRGNALLELDDTEAALASYARAIQERPDFDDAHWNYAVVLRRTGRLDEALDAFGALCRLEPENERAQELREETRRQLAAAQSVDE